MSAGNDRVDSAPPAASPEGSTTLGQLCVDLAPDLIEVAVAPRGIDVPITSILLHNPVDRLPHEHAAGCLLLAVGASPGDETLSSFVRSAATAEVSAIACLGVAEWSRQLLDLAGAVGVALLSVSPQIEWGELYELTRAALVVDFDQGDRPVSSERPALTDLSATAEALAAIAGGSVTIDDVHSRVLAFSGGEAIDEMRTTSILTRRTPEQWLREMRERGIIHQLLTSDDVIHVDLDKSEPRRAIAIRLGESMVGSIWLAGKDAELSPDADDALRRAAPLAALQLMRQRVSTDVERRMRESAVATLLLGGETSLVALEQIGLETDKQFVVVVLEVTARSTSTPPAVGARLIDLLTMHLHAYEHPAVATSLKETPLASAAENERIYVLTSSRGDEDRASLLRHVADCVKHASRSLGVELRAGVGHEVEVPEALPVGRRSAEDCLAFAPASAQVVSFEEVHDWVLLSEVEQFVADWHAKPSSSFRRLAEHDASHGTEYVETLSAVLDAFGSASLVSQRLHLHVNTVRYRIKRIGEITGVDFTDGNARLALELTLRARTRER